MDVKMKIEDQVCSLELAKKLKDLGVKQESLFWWEEYPSIYNLRYYPHKIIFGEDNIKFYSAFTVAELLNIFPLINGCPLQLFKGINFVDTETTYCARYDLLPMTYQEFNELTESNPANALAKMLIYLITEEGLKIND